METHQLSSLTMWLSIAGKTLLENPNAAEITDALKSLDSGDSGFVILSKTEMVYIQVSGSTSRGFSLEYRDGSPREHYCCLNEVSLEDIINAFQSYAAGSRWQQDTWKWEQLNKYVGRLHPTRQKVRRPVWNIWNLCYCAFAAMCALTVFFGKQPGANLGMWLRLFFSAIALCFVVATTRDLRAGNSQLRFGKITRSKSPVQFWSGIVTGYAVSFIILAIVILSALGILR